jgi:four helix bundle protein
MFSSTDQNNYNLEKRTLAFAKSILQLCKKLRSDAINKEIIKQLMRSSGSVGANYREANEALGKKDKIYRIRIARKECKETSYWLDLILENNEEFAEAISSIRGESRELRNIFSTILMKIK